MLTPDPRLPRIVVAAVALLLLVATGCEQNPSTPSPADPTERHYTAVGASDAVGIGASVPCTPFSACPDGTGYVPIIARQLASPGVQVILLNLGIPAAVIGPRLQAIGRSYGRTIPGNFLEQEMPFVARGSTHVTVFAGGNDTNTLVAAVGSGAGGDDPLGWVNARIGEFNADYQTLVQGIRERAPSARIVVANLPNFAGMPFTAIYPPDARQLVQHISVRFSVEAINRLADQGIAVVDMLCDPRSYLPSTYSSDGFHPSDAGYAVLADEMLRAFAQGSAYPRPLASCPQMALVPGF